MAATLLASGVTTLTNVPNISDVHVMGKVLKGLGATIDVLDEHTLRIDTSAADSWEAPYELVAKMRASTAVMGPLLGRFGRAKIAMPGGCNLGARKIDMHILGLEALGVSFDTDHGYIHADARDGLVGAMVSLEFASVGATENLIMAAVRARGTTVIDNAAREPEIVDLANMLNEMGAKMHTTSGPAIERAGDLAAILTNLEEGDVLFVDEIHRLNHQIEEVLYPAMEDFFLDIVIGKGPAARSIRIDVPHFTLVGATTRTGLLTGPLRDRFGISYRLDYYTPAELAVIVSRSAKILGAQIDERGAAEIASRSRGTPRLANRLLKRVRDYAQVKREGTITGEVADEALEFFEIDALGLDTMDVRILTALCSTFRGRPVGLTTVASAVSEDPATLEDVYEPYLLQRGLMIRTPQGRQATLAAFDHLGIEPPAH